MSIKQRIARLLRLGPLPADALQTASAGQVGYLGPTTERGARITSEEAMRRQYRLQFWVDTELRAMIQDIREMDRLDPRVKKVHSRTARHAVKGGLIMEAPGAPAHLRRRWRAFHRRMQLCEQGKLESDARGLLMEGNLAMQWLVDNARQVVGGVRMPIETIVPMVDDSGRITDPAHAYEQRDLMRGSTQARFAAWQLTLKRLDPSNYDDQGALGRPYLDATRTTWRKLTMTEEDLVIRRRERAPMRTAHVLEGATKEDIDDYQRRIEEDQKEITTNYFLNRRGGVTALQGDANLDQIKDIALLLDAFFSGAPAPKGLFGYPDGLNRDILEDLKRDYYDELDALQDTLANAYSAGFRLQLLLDGLNPDTWDWQIRFLERRTETPNQAADRALKLQALGASQDTALRTAGLDPAAERKKLEREADETDPYPRPDQAGNRGAPTVKVTPGNGRKGDSATTIATRG